MKTQTLPKLKQQVIPNAGTIVVVLFILFAYNAWAAPVAQDPTPGVISYQGSLVNDAGEPVSGNTDMIFRLYDAPTGGTALWTEAHTSANAVPVQDGLFHVLLGSLTPIPATVWDNASLYLGIQVGSEPEMSPREQLGAVPFAMAAGTADVATIAGGLTDGAVAQGHLDVEGWLTGRTLVSESSGEGVNAGTLVLRDTTSQGRWEVSIRGQSSDQLFFVYGWPPSNYSVAARLDPNGDLFLSGSVVQGAVIERNLMTQDEITGSRPQKFSEGDLLCWNNQVNQLEKCAKQGSSLVVAVADKNGRPIVLGAEPVKVLGPVEPGDLLVASDIPGYAIAWSEVGEGSPPVGVVIAKALEPFEENRGTIKAMIQSW